MKVRGRALFLMLFVVIFAAWWGVSVLGRNSSVSATSSSESVLVVNHSRVNNVDTYSGNIMMPACDTLGTGVESEGLTPRRVTVALTTSEISSCSTTTKSEVPFSVSVSTKSGSAPLFDGVSINGSLVLSMLVEEF